MRITEYGQKLCRETKDAEALVKQVDGKTGVSGHLEALKTDTGLIIVVTGQGYPAVRYGSVAAAYWAMVARRSFENAWHVDKNGKRKLVITKAG